MRSHSFWACLTALALTAGGRADDAYTIKIKQGPDVGKAVTVTDTDSKTSSTKVTDADGKVLKDGAKQTEKTDEVYTETVLARKDKDATKYKRTYKTATRTRDGKAEARSYQGRTVLFEKKDGKFTVTVEGDKPLSKEDLADLTHKADEADSARDEVFLPTKPLKVGGIWKVEGKDIVKAFGKGGDKFDADHTGAEGKLVKVYKKDGHQFGVMEVRMKLAPAPDPKVKYEKPPVVEMKLTLDAAIDGSTPAGTATMTGGMVAKVTVEQGGKNFTVDSTLDLSSKKEQSGEK